MDIIEDFYGFKIDTEYNNGKLNKVTFNRLDDGDSDEEFEFYEDDLELSKLFMKLVDKFDGDAIDYSKLDVWNYLINNGGIIVDCKEDNSELRGKLVRPIGMHGVQYIGSIDSTHKNNSYNVTQFRIHFPNYHDQQSIINKYMTNYTLDMFKNSEYLYDILTKILEDNRIKYFVFNEDLMGIIFDSTRSIYFDCSSQLIVNGDLIKYIQNINDQYINILNILYKNNKHNIGVKLYNNKKFVSYNCDNFGYDHEGIRFYFDQFRDIELFNIMFPNISNKFYEYMLKYNDKILISYNNINDVCFMEFLNADKITNIMELYNYLLNNRILNNEKIVICNHNYANILLDQYYNKISKIYGNITLPNKDTILYPTVFDDYYAVILRKDLFNYNSNFIKNLIHIEKYYT